MSQARKRVPGDSVCAQPTEDPRLFHYYVDAGDAAVDVYQEIMAAVWPPGRAAGMGAHLMGDVLGRLRAAAKGELRGGDELTVVSQNPNLWEIAWRKRKQGEFRMYHSEPGYPALVGLLFHEKDTTGSDSTKIKRLQNAKIDEAGRRHAEGVNRDWGHKKGCAHDLAP